MEPPLDRRIRTSTAGNAGRPMRIPRSAGQRRENALEHLVDVADTIDGLEFADLGEMFGNRFSLRAIDVQALAHDRRIVVLALLGGETDFAAAEDRAVGHVELDRDIQWLAEPVEQRFERRTLRQVARVTIEDE